MASRVDLQAVFLSAGAVLVSGALLFFGTGMHPVWWFTWLATLPVLLIAPACRVSPPLGSHVWHGLTCGGI